MCITRVTGAINEGRNLFSKLKQTLGESRRVFTTTFRESRAAKPTTAPRINEEFMLAFNKEVTEAPLALPPATAETVARDIPRMNLNRLGIGNVDELEMSRVVLKDGTYVRYFRRPGSNRVVFEMKDFGLLHEEKCPSGPHGIVELRQIGKNETAIIQRNGNCYQRYVENTKQYGKGKDQTISDHFRLENNPNQALIIEEHKGLNGEENSRTILARRLNYNDGVPYLEVNKGEYQGGRKFYGDDGGWGYFNGGSAQLYDPNLINSQMHNYGCVRSDLLSKLFRNPLDLLKPFEG